MMLLGTRPDGMMLLGTRPDGPGEAFKQSAAKRFTGTTFFPQSKKIVTLR
jgi:hypothetical protein